MSKLRLVYMASPDIAVPALEALHAAGHELAAVVTQPDRRAGRGKKLTPCAVAARARDMGLALMQPEKVGDMAGELAALKADAACVMAFGQLLPPAVLELFPLGCVNVHASLLPRLRGAAPINWAIIRGLAETGVTTMMMDAGLDTGDMLLKATTPIEPQDTAGTLADRLAGMGAELLVETLERLAAGDCPRQPQDHALSDYAPRLKKSDGLMDWTRSAAELDRRVRGLDPWPGAHTSLEGRALKLFAPTRVEAAPHGAAPGTVLAPPPGGEGMMWVACGQGALGLDEVQAAGKKRMAAADFARGAHLQPGQELGG